ncbi:MAG: hypothetical protein Roseis2KO_21120 [Roseivirga sp.]
MATKVISVKSIKKVDSFRASKSMIVEEELPEVDKYLSEGYEVGEIKDVTPPQSEIFSHLIFVLVKRESGVL